MNFKNFFYLVVGCMTSAVAKGQTDSSDINFYATPFVPQTLEDSLQYGAGDLSTLYLDFTISDMAGFGKVWIEVSTPGGVLLYRSCFTAAGLNAAGFLNESDVTMELGKFEAVTPCRLFVTLENQHGLRAPVLTKTLTP